jgi:multiple sugar transport system permease protein
VSAVPARLAAVEPRYAASGQRSSRDARRNRFLNRFFNRFLRDHKARTGLVFIAPALAFLVVFVAYPVIDVVRLSFHLVDFATDQEKFVGLANFIQVLRDAKLGTVAWNTLVWTIFSLAGQFALGLTAALCINQRLPGMTLIRTILLLPYVVPVIALALFWRWMLDGSFGIVSAALQSAGVIAHDQSPLAIPEGAMASVILANIWRGFPFVMISYWAALQAIPHELYEAASVDGAGPWQEFRYVTLPHLVAITKVMLVLRLIWTVTFFDIIWLITRGGPGGATEHWPIWIYQETMGFFRFGSGAALAVLLAGTLMLLSAVYLIATRRSAAQ